MPTVNIYLSEQTALFEYNGHFYPFYNEDIVDQITALDSPLDLIETVYHIVSYIHYYTPFEYSPKEIATFRLIATIHLSN